MTKRHRAIALINEVALRQQVSDLLPDYDFTWALPLSDSIRQAADLRASFLLADIDDLASEWKAIALGLQSNPATRRLPMVGLAATVDEETMRLAASASLYGPLGRSVLAAQLPAWVAHHARVWDEEYYHSLAEGCADRLPPLAQEGIALFNQHEFWEAHEVLEHAWMEVRPAPIGEVYRSILQVGVAYYQIQKGNYRGALKMFLRAVQWLDPLPDHCQGVDLAQFKHDAAAARSALEALGPERISEFDTALFKPVPIIE
jgi:hypothetical protein